MTRTVAVVIVVAKVTLLGCSDPGERDAASASPMPLLFSALSPARFAVPVGDPASAVRYARGIARVLSGRQLEAAKLSAYAAAVGTGNASQPVVGALDDDPSLVVGFDRSTRHWGINAAVTRNTDGGTRDVGLAGAEQVFRVAVDALEREDIIRKSDYALGAVSVETLKAGVGGPNGERRQWIKEYFFSVPRMVNDVEVLESSLEVSVHRDGSLARVFLGGPAIAAESSTFAPAVTAAALDARFRKDFPGAIVQWSGVRYVFGSAGGVVKPTYVYRFSRVFDVGGQRVESRAQYVAFSLDRPNEAPTVWPKYDHANTRGDQRQEAD